MWSRQVFDTGLVILCTSWDIFKLRIVFKSECFWTFFAHKKSILKSPKITISLFSRCAFSMFFPSLFSSAALYEGGRWTPAISRGRFDLKGQVSSHKHSRSVALRSSCRLTCRELFTKARIPPPDLPILSLRCRWNHGVE